MSAAMYQDREQPEAAPMDRADLVEMEARAFHESDKHPYSFGTCALGCWEDAEIEVDRAIFEGRLQLVAVD